MAYWRASGLDLAPLLMEAVPEDDSTRHCSRGQDHALGKALDVDLIAQARGAIGGGGAVRFSAQICNVNRTVGTMLGHEVTLAHPEGLPTDHISIDLTGEAGQSLGAFLPAGITLRLNGEANDYVGKGPSGGRIIVRPAPGSPIAAEANVIAATSARTAPPAVSCSCVGRLVSGSACATPVPQLSSKASATHGCEYMTGGARARPRDRGPQLRRRNVRWPRPRARPRAPPRQPRTRRRAAAARRRLDRARARFSTVVPRAYQRVLDVRDEAESQGLSVESPQVWERIMEVTRG